MKIYDAASGFIEEMKLYWNKSILTSKIKILVHYRITESIKCVKGINNEVWTRKTIKGVKDLWCSIWIYRGNKIYWDKPILTSKILKYWSIIDYYVREKQKQKNMFLWKRIIMNCEPKKKRKKAWRFMMQHLDLLRKWNCIEINPY